MPFCSISESICRHLSLLSQLPPTLCMKRNFKYVFLPQVLKSLVCQVCVCVSAGIYRCAYIWVSLGVQNALAHGTSVFECKCECVCVVYQLVRRRWVQGDISQGGAAVCRLLSSLYSNDRPCCFTCCGRRSAAKLSPCTSPSL